MTTRLGAFIGSRIRGVSARSVGLAALTVLAFDLIAVNARPLSQAFTLPSPPIPARGPFRHIDGLPQYDARGYLPDGAAAGATSAWSALYPAILANLGTLEMTGPMASDFRPSARSSESSEYRGEVYLEGTEGQASFQTFSPNRLRISVDARTSGLLVINQNFDAGWRSSAGSAQATRGLLSTPVRAGKQSIDLYYLPSSFILGAVISVGAITLCAIRFAWGLLRRRRRLREDPTLIRASL